MQFEIMQAVSAVRYFGARSSIIRRADCRNWLHFYRIPCRLSLMVGKELCALINNITILNSQFNY